MAIGYYAFTIGAQNTNAPAYYGVLFTSQLEVFQGSFQFIPTGITSTMVGTDGSNINLQLPACAGIQGGVTLATSASSVGGNIYVSPPLSVPVTFELWGLNQIGSVTVQPGQGRATFNFDVTGQQALDAAGAQAVISKLAPKPPRPA